MRISLTGSAGFVGNNLTTYLQEYQITVQSISRQALNEADLRLPDKAHAIVHLAGKAHDLKPTANSDEYYQVNLGLTIKLYNAFLQSDAAKFIFISSVKAAADSLLPN